MYPGRIRDVQRPPAACAGPAEFPLRTRSCSPQTQQYYGFKERSLVLAFSEGLLLKSRDRRPDGGYGPAVILLSGFYSYCTIRGLLFRYDLVYLFQLFGAKLRSSHNADIVKNLCGPGGSDQNRGHGIVF